MRRWIAAALALIAAAGLGLLIWQLDFPSWQPLDLSRIREIPESTMVYDGAGNAAGALLDSRERRYAPLEEIPDHVISAFITAEDQRFYEHSGVDVRRIFGALWHDIKTMSLSQGASTITQQLIKLTHLSSEKTLARKAQEIVLARRLERRMSKQEILEAYLNTVYFGNGAYGIGSAARAYFGKDAQQLTLAEGALLSGVIKSPSSYAPHLNPEAALRRRDNILRAMLDAGEIDSTECEAALSEPLSLSVSAAEGGLGGWYGDLVLEEAQQLLSCGAEELLTGGYHIYTYLDPAAQAVAEALFESGASFPDPADDGTPAQAALIALECNSGGICAVVGGREYQVQRGLNRATGMQRQPGSAIKPISTYAAAIEDYGFLPSSMVQDVQREFPGKYLPGNAGGSYYGTVTLREALSRSLNVATVDLADLIGISAVRRTLSRFGVPLSAQDINLSLALGSMTNGLSPARLCATYCALANGGMRVEPRAIRRITSASGRLLYEAEAPKERAVSPQTAFLLTDMLKTAASSGSAKALAEAGVPVAGKTGTVGESGGGNRDIWTAAYTPELAVSVWMGFDEPGAGHALPDSAGGSSYPARLCAAFLKGMKNGLSGADFSSPDGLVSARIDRMALSADKALLLAAENTPEEYVAVEWFPAGSAPEARSAYWNAPQPVDDLQLISASGETPTLAFTCRDSGAEYLILRSSGDESEVAAALSAQAGETIVWADAQADLKTSHSYRVLPRHRLLYESGVLLTGGESRAVQYSPGGFFSRLFR